MISAFDIFKIGIGPSSSHTVGPMNAGKSFIDLLVSSGELPRTTHIVVDLYGSLSLTGKGHATDVAIMMGLAGNSPQNVLSISLQMKIFFFILKPCHAMKMACVSPRGTAPRGY